MPDILVQPEIDDENRLMGWIGFLFCEESRGWLGVTQLEVTPGLASNAALSYWYSDCWNRSLNRLSQD